MMIEVDNNRIMITIGGRGALSGKLYNDIQCIDVHGIFLI